MIDFIIGAVRSLTFRGKARLLHRLVSHTRVKNAEIFGVDFELDLADYIQRSIYLGTFETAETRIIRDLLRPGMTFVDVGANVGYYTALASSLVGSSGRVEAFEPSPYAFSRLSSLIERNKLTNVRATRCGLGAVSGEQPLYVLLEFGNHTPTLVGEGAPYCHVPISTLEKELGDADVDLMKIDVEGYELEVLRGAAGLLSLNRIRAIMCEHSPDWLARAGTTSDELEAFIVDAGFRKVWESGDGANRFYKLAVTRPHTFKQ